MKSFQEVWLEKADFESLIYSGSRAVTGRKDKFLDELDNSIISLKRLYNQKFIDRMKQAALDVILFNEKKFQRDWSSTVHKKFTSPFRIATVTWNVNAVHP